MKFSAYFLGELQRRLKIGNRRGVHLNAIPGRSRYKFDLSRLAHIDKDLPNRFINSLLSEQPLKFRVSWKENVPDLNDLFEEEQLELVKITRSLENLINQTETIESEKGINTFGFGYPILIRRDRADNQLTVAPILIWSLRMKRTKEFNTWEIIRKEDDPIYINEVLINHLESDSAFKIEQIPAEMLDDGLIEKDELLEICLNIIKAINTSYSDDLADTFRTKMEEVVRIGEKSKYEKLPLASTNAFIEFGGLFSIFEIQKQNIIQEYDRLLGLEGKELPLDDLNDHCFQPISCIETDPSQQAILHAMETSRNLLIQGPPGTGKSQTLTAILINALENNKKVLVVCEKITALDVLHNSLKDKGLENLTVFLRDIVKDRRAAVDSVRNREASSSHLLPFKRSAKKNLDIIIARAGEIISEINNKHLALDEELLSGKNWTDIVGELLKELRVGNKGKEWKLEPSFEYNIDEMNRLLEITRKGEILYRNYKSIGKESFINEDKFQGDNPYQLEQQIRNDFRTYADKLNELNSLEEKIKEEYLSKRKSHFIETISSLEKKIESIKLWKSELLNLYSKSRDEYYSFRQKNFSDWMF